MQLVIILSLALCAAALCENFLHQRNLQKIPLRIMINGTRGKSSVTRLIAGVLREAGYTTIAKTTGSEAVTILEDGSEVPVKRPFGPRITEQKALARLAARRKADALVVECMAVRPESQMVMQSQLVRATIGVITNARVDHIDEMGRGLAETAEALASTIPRSGTLITTESSYLGKARRVLVVNPSSVSEETLARFSYPIFAENVSLAFAVAEELGINRETALAGMVQAKPDIGVLRVFTVKRPTFTVTVINGFAANDAVSTRMIWDKVSARLPQGQPLVIFYNNRADREFRIREFVKLAARIPGVSLVVACGDNSPKVSRMFAKSGFQTMAAEPRTDIESMLTSIGKTLCDTKSDRAYTLFGVGNIQGTGRNLVEWCTEEECCRNR